jgi:hypothetical protein
LVPDERGLSIELDCEYLKEEFLPINYSETARENLLKYRQTEGQSVGKFLARFKQLEGYLPRPLPFTEKKVAIQKNILPSYQDRLWDKEIASPDDLYRLWRRLEATLFQYRPTRGSAARRLVGPDPFGKDDNRVERHNPLS